MPKARGSRVQRLAWPFRLRYSVLVVSCPTCAARATWVELAAGAALCALVVSSCGESSSAPASVDDEDEARAEAVAVPAAAPAVEGAPTRPDDAHRRVRDDARLVLERYCGSCHISAYETALPGALAVYDLLEEEWAVRATDVQLRDIVFRLGEPLGPDAEPLEVALAERETVERYVEAEIARRASVSGSDPTPALPSTAGGSL